MRASRTHDPVEQAVEHLRRADPRLAQIIARVGAYRVQITRNPFLALVGSIVHQQVSMSAAMSIRRRLTAACPQGRVTPAALLALGDGEMRAAGLSRQKTGYLRNVAEAFATGALSSRKLRRMNDEDVIASTTQIKGVGRWTAEMLLIFSLERPDVWPVDDLGLRMAVGRLLGLKATPKPHEIESVGDPWRPYRSCATWYLWRSLDRQEQPAIGPGK